MQYFITRTPEGWVVKRGDGLFMRYDCAFTFDEDTAFVFGDAEKAAEVFHRIYPAYGLSSLGWGKIVISTENEMLVALLANFVNQCVVVASHYSGTFLDDPQMLEWIKIICNDKDFDSDHELKFGIPMPDIYKRAIQHLRQAFSEPLATLDDHQQDIFMSYGMPWVLNAVSLDTIFRDGIWLDEQICADIIGKKITTLEPESITWEQLATVIKDTVQYISR